MAYLVLALGALLSIGGALSIFQGAGIVQVERGWTGVIAGATSLTGGIITIALGLILRVLLDLRGRNDRPMRNIDGIVTASGDASVPAPQVEPLSSPAANEPSAPEPDFEGGLLAAFLAPKADVPPDRTLPAVHTEVVASHPVPEPSSEPPAIAAEQPELAKSRFKINFESFETPAAVEPVPLSKDHPQVPAMDDWLDRAFSSLDNEALAGAGEPHQLSPGAAATAASQAEMTAGDLPDIARDHHAVAELEPASAELPVEHRPEPAPPLAALPSTAPPPPQAAVIGRYEADGTSYIMFSDGSIEAQSDAGVYRFGSMTELKAFIEGTG